MLGEKADFPWDKALQSSRVLILPHSSGGRSRPNLMFRQVRPNQTCKNNEQREMWDSKMGLSLFGFKSGFAEHTGSPMCQQPVLPPGDMWGFSAQGARADIPPTCYHVTSCHHKAILICMFLLWEETPSRLPFQGSQSGRLLPFRGWWLNECTGTHTVG